MWKVEQEHDVIGIFYYTRGWQQEGTAENTSGEPSYGPVTPLIAPIGRYTNWDFNLVQTRLICAPKSDETEAEGLIAQNPPQDDLQDPIDLGPGFRKASSSSRCSRRRQQVAASRQQEQGCKAPDMTQCVTRCKNGEICEVDVFRCYSTQVCVALFY